MTLHGQSLVLKDVEAVLVALRTALLSGGRLGGGAELPGPLQQAQVVLQRVAQVVAVAEITDRWELFKPSTSILYLAKDNIEKGYVLPCKLYQLYQWLVTTLPSWTNLYNVMNE